MIDSHCHLDFSEISSSLLQQLAAARAVGVKGWIVPGCFIAQWSHLVELQRRLSVEAFELWACAGQHPRWVHEVASPDEFSNQLFTACRTLSVVAIGECGVDRGSRATQEEQARYFELQLNIASELDLPVVLHQVGLQDLFLKCLKRVGLPAAGGVVHGFSGPEDWGAALIKRGLHLGIGSGVTRPQRRKLRRAAQSLPLESLLLEKDAPDQRLHDATAPGLPCDLLQVCVEVAQLRHQRTEDIAAICEKNTRKLFQL